MRDAWFSLSLVALLVAFSSCGDALEVGDWPPDHAIGSGIGKTAGYQGVLAWNTEGRDVWAWDLARSRFLFSKAERVFPNQPVDYALSGNGKVLAYTYGIRNLKYHQAFHVNLSTGKASLFPQHEVEKLFIYHRSNISLSANGKRLALFAHTAGESYSQSGEITMEVWDFETRERIVVKRTDPSSFIVEANNPQIQIDAAGENVFFVCGNWFCKARVEEDADHEVFSLADSPELGPSFQLSSVSFSLSADGRWLAFASNWPQSMVTAPYLLDTTSGAFKGLGRHEGVVAISLSADGSRFAFVDMGPYGDEGAQPQLHVGLVENLSASPASIGKLFTGPVALSGDGKQVAYASRDSESKEAEVWVARTDGSDARKVSDKKDGNLIASPGFMRLSF